MSINTLVATVSNTSTQVHILPTVWMIVCPLVWGLLEVTPRIEQLVENPVPIDL